MVAEFYRKSLLEVKKELEKAFIELDKLSFEKTELTMDNIARITNKVNEVLEEVRNKTNCHFKGKISLENNEILIDFFPMDEGTKRVYKHLQELLEEG